MLAPTLRSILVATDLSDASGAALRTAARLAARTGAALHAVHAFESPPAPYSAAYSNDGVTVPDLHEFNHAIRSLELELDAHVEAAVPPGTRCTRRIRLGPAGRVVRKRAAEVQADLLVLGPHRKRVLGDSLRSGTADQLLHACHTPCLVVPAELDLPLRRVVVPFDLADPGHAAVDSALRWAAAFGAREGVTGLPELEMKVVHVLPAPATPPRLPFDHAVVGPALHADVEAALARARGACEVEVTEEIVFGESPAAAIAAYAARGGAGLVVMGTHGYGAVRRALIGSVASGVARTASCPVLLVPPAVAAPAHAAEAVAEAVAVGV